MDDVEELEIWERFESQVDLSDLTATDGNELAERIKEKLQSLNRGKKANIAIKNLLSSKAHFHERAVRNATIRERLDNIVIKNVGEQDQLKIQRKEREMAKRDLRKKEIEKLTPKQKAIIFSQALPQGFAITPTGRIKIIRKGKPTRAYNPNKLKFTYGVWKNQSAVWVSKDKKLLTWRTLSQVGYPTLKMNKKDLKK